MIHVFYGPAGRKHGHKLDRPFMWIKFAALSPRRLLQIKKPACILLMVLQKMTLLKIVQGFSSIKADDMPEDAGLKKYHLYGEIGLLSVAK